MRPASVTSKRHLESGEMKANRPLKDRYVYNRFESKKDNIKDLWKLTINSLTFPTLFAFYHSPSGALTEASLVSIRICYYFLATFDLRNNREWLEAQKVYVAC